MRIRRSGTRSPAFRRSGDSSAPRPARRPHGTPRLDREVLGEDVVEPYEMYENRRVSEQPHIDEARPVQPAPRRQARLRYHEAAGEAHDDHGIQIMRRQREDGHDLGAEIHRQEHRQRLEEPEVMHERRRVAVELDEDRTGPRSRRCGDRRIIAGTTPTSTPSTIETAGSWLCCIDRAATGRAGRNPVRNPRHNPSEVFRLVRSTARG